MLSCFDVALVCVNDWNNVHMWVMERDVAYGIPNPPSHAWEGETKKRESLSWVFPSSMHVEEYKLECDA